MIIVPHSIKKLSRLRTRAGEHTHHHAIPAASGEPSMCMSGAYMTAFQRELMSSQQGQPQINDWRHAPAVAIPEFKTGRCTLGKKQGLTAMVVHQQW